MCGDQDCLSMLADEEDVLQAVLLFLDEHDAVSPTMKESECFSSQSFASMMEVTLPSPTRPKPQPQTKRTIVRSDKRKREEIMALREEAAALEERLCKLKNVLRGPPNAGLEVQGHNTQPAYTDLRRFHVSAWQAVTEAQQKRRVAAEQERERLRELIHDQKVALRGIRRYTNRHASKARMAVLSLDPTIGGRPIDEVGPTAILF